MDPIETIPMDGLTVEIHRDDDEDGPRDWDNLGTMTCWHSKYSLGGKHGYERPHNLLAALVREVGLDEQALHPLINALVSEPTKHFDGTVVKYGRLEYREQFGDRTRKERRDEWLDYLADTIDEGNTTLALDSEIWTALEAAGLIVLPLHLYDHSGITMSTGGFSCPWDSGQVGYIYVTPKALEEEYKGSGMDPAKWAECAKGVLEGEVKNNGWVDPAKLPIG